MHKLVTQHGRIRPLSCMPSRQLGWSLRRPPCAEQAAFWRRLEKILQDQVLMVPLGYQKQVGQAPLVVVLTCVGYLSLPMFS